MKEDFENALREDFEGNIPSFLDMSWNNSLGCYNDEKTDYMYFGFILGITSKEEMSE